MPEYLKVINGDQEHSQFNSFLLGIDIGDPQLEYAEPPVSHRRYILRWVGVLPGALLCVFIVTFPIHWVVMLIQHFGTSFDTSGRGSPLSFYYYLAMLSPEVLETFGNAFFTPFVLITAGANIAPQFKFPTGIGLAVALGVVYGVAATAIAEDISRR